MMKDITLSYLCLLIGAKFGNELPRVSAHEAEISHLKDSELSSVGILRCYHDEQENLAMHPESDCNVFSGGFSCSRC